MPNPSVASKQFCTLGESPIWSIEEQALYWVDIVKKRIHRLTPLSDHVDRWQMRVQIGSIGFSTNGYLIAGTRQGLGFIKLSDGSFELITDPEGSGKDNPVRMNDGKVDRQGRFWCGGIEDPGCREIASLYRLDPDYTVHIMESSIAISNSICWSPDDSTMYFADSLKAEVWAYDFNSMEGTIHNRRVFVDMKEEAGVPDGATVDSDGFLWVALFGAGMVKRYDPNGKVERTVRFPVSQISCPAFGGVDMKTLFVTTASQNFKQDDFKREPNAGALFSLETNVRGIPEPTFDRRPKIKSK
tara:strand:+ start:701 stop:1600 length:900 start_codon:yes stop_codon:yes gene_type:complete